MAKKRKTASKPEPVVKQEEPIFEEEVEPKPETKEAEESGSESESSDSESEESEESDSESEEKEESSESEEEEKKGKKIDREKVKKLLEPFGKDQLVDILREISVKNPSFISKINKAAEHDPSHRKIFVHGLGWDATNEALISIFKKFGTIEDCKVVSDKLTGRAKGYGFILFKHRSGARKALKQPQKKIGNRLTSCQLASAGPVPTQHPGPDLTGKKIYVSNVASDITPQKLYAFFSRFGEIEEGPLGLDKVTGKPRGFAIFVYKSPESVKKVLEEPFKNFEGHNLHCQKAVEGMKLIKAGPNMALNSGVGPSLNALLAAGQGPGMRIPPVLNPSGVGVSPVVNPSGITGVSPSLNQGVSGVNLANAGSFGSSGLSGYGAQHQQGLSGINSVNPSVVGNYGSQAALQGLGAYQNPQVGAQASAVRSQGMGPLGGLTSYPGY
ncbi:UBP1-associated protein 2A [Amborella trichopoda]|uniref:RRM domain-containing protein n=1 Tax=Amborella trichopoda TaxID=13333 RepID=W1NUS0_AMBTC|nr:UBP1-associated protein 2A [Amborella trichopoda]ERM99010.1 hypothetical protein AMTR_s00101p00040700 [Amborella trichopoda]|eukprot:XP_006836157.1 UBP1-associated protein 2A [Amborella trichopoda]